MRAVLGSEAISSAFDVLVRGGGGDAEFRPNLFVRKSKRDQPGRLDFAPAHAGRRDIVGPEGAKAGQQTFTDQAQECALRLLEFGRGRSG